MQKYTTSFLGRDCPGIVAAVSRLFAEIGCNIEAMTQTMLSGEFAAIFVVSAPEDQNDKSIVAFLEQGLKKANIDLSLLIRPAIEAPWSEGIQGEAFVVTVDGPDGTGIISDMSNVFGRHGVNIDNLTAIMGETAEGQALFVFELMVPNTVDLGRLRRELNHEGRKHGLRVNLQHRDIFEAVHRVPSF